MQRCSFALTALDVRMVEPVQSLDQLNVPEWSRGSALAKVPVVRLFGISRQGASVCAHVHGCWPFFYVELSEEAAARLGSKSHSCTEELMTEEIARPRELAAAIEDAAQRARPAKPVKVVNLRLERWRSIYGLRITPSPFLRVELTDARDVEMVAGLLQSNEVEAIGFAQAHEAHLPFLLHFLAEHHLSGAGLCRVSGTERASRLSRCALELDVVAPEGLVNSLEYRELLRRAGQGSEARALSALRSQLGRQYNQLPSPSAGHVSVSRPGAAARTPAAVRHALHRWLRGGAAPVHEASEAFTEMAMEMANAWKIAQEKVQDIEDLAGKAGRRRRRPASPARYSNPADDPRSKDHSAATKALPPQTGRPEAPRGSEPAQAPKRPPVSAEHAEWEDLAAFLAVEVLTVQASGQKKQEAVGQQLVAVCYALRPHGCLLGGRQMRPEDQRGALVVSHDRWEEERWQEDLKQMKLELRRVNSEEELLEALVELVQNADPDVCLGWDVRSRSWGLLAARAKALGRQDLRTALSRVPYDATSLPLSALASSPPLSGQGQDLRTLESEMVAPSDLQLPGRMLLNVWRLLMHLTFGAKLRSFAPQEAARELLGRSFPKISLQEMDEHWSKGSSSLRLALLQHVADLAALSLEISDVLEIFPRAGELSRLFGMDILSGFTRGTQLRVESLLMRVAHADGFRLLSASQEQVRAQPALECLPLVMEPCSGFYWDPVLVLDFKGMYPSLIVAHNLSFDTCLGHSRRTGEGPSCQMGVLNGPWVLNGSSLADLFDSEDPADAPVHLAASGALFASPQVRTGLLPLMLDEVLKLRAETKRQAKQSSPAVAKRLEHKQFALKYFANVTYGYSSASFSGRMPCSELADAIVATGRRALEEAANFIEANWEGAKIVYGDTDSVFVQLKGYSLEEAFGAGREICAKVSAKHPAPVELEFEKVYMPCLCLTKKRYGGLAYAKAPSEGGVGRFEAKGLEAIRRDQCRMASNVQNEVLNDFFRSKDLSGVKQIFMSHAVSLLKGGAFGHTVADLSFFREARLGTYRAEADDGGSATLPPQAAVAMNRIATEGDAVAPSFGERISFAVALDDVGARLVDRSVFPAQLAEAGAGSSASRLDRWWYVEKALLPAIRRILHSDLVGLPPNLDVTAWLRQVPRPSASSRGAPGPLGRLLRPSCRKCGEKVLCGELCRACASPALRAELQESLQQSRQAAEELWKQCADCAGPLWRSCRAAEFCPVRTRRAEAETELQRLQTLIRELEPPEEATGADDWKHQDTLVFDIASGSEEADMEVEAASSTVKCEGGDDQPTLSVSSDDDLGPPSPAGRGPSASGGVPSAGVAGFVPPEPPEPERPSSLPLCKHQELCREVEVKKEGPNKGRHFFVCPRVREEQCDFFAWADRALPTSSRNAPGGPSTPPPKTRKKTDVKTTPAKRRRMTQASREGRLERFVATPSRRVKERIERAKEHRLLLVNLKVVERGEIAAAVVGHTGNVYDVRVGARVLCTCLDFVKARSACKHLLFLFLRVFQLPDDDPRLWQRALLARELSELRHRLETLDLTEVQAPEHVVSASRAPVLREAAGRPCPVCFDPVVHLAGSCCCAGCGRNLHAECLEQWRTGTSSSRHNLLDCLVLSGVRSTLSCPLCAAPAETTATHRVEALQAVAATKASPGQPLRRHVNVSSVSELHSDPKSLEETYPETFKWIARKGARTETTETRSDPSGGPQTGSV